MERQQRLGHEPIGRLLFNFSIPAIVGMLVNALYNIVDRAYIGHIPVIGDLAITGVGITLPIMTIILAFGMLIGVGSAACISLRLGKHKKDEAEEILGNAVTLLIIVGLAISIFGNLFAKDILSLFGASSKTLVYAEQFVSIIFYGTIFSIVSFGLNNCIRAEGSPKIAMITMLLGAILNTILDPIFIFVFGLGVRGAAIATVISQIATTIWTMRYYLSGSSTLKIRIKNLKLKLSFMKSIFAIGMSPFSMQLAASLVQIIANASLITYGGDLAVGAMTIISSISMIFFMPIFGVNQGSQPIIGFNYGAKQFKRVKDTVKYGAIAATIIMSVGFLIVQIFPEMVIKIFNKDKTLVDTTVQGIRIYLAMIPVVGFQIISSNYFQSIGKAKISMFLSLLRQVIILIPMLVILPKFFGLIGVWCAGPISDGLSSLVTGVIFYKDIKKLHIQQ